jgi:hypothetical protein
MNNRITRTVALGLALVGLSVGTAYAQSDARIDGKYGYVTFQANGEIIEAADIWEDGYGVRAILRWEGGSAHVNDYGGLYGKSRNLSIREGTTVYLTLCYTNNGKAFNCSDPERGEA